MCKTAEYRYAKSKGDREKQVNLHIREMIEMLKNEDVEEKLHANTVYLTKHACQRMEEHFNANDFKSATRVARDMLKHAVRIGTVLAYDGRINVLYAYRQTAFFLSPDLKKLVTVNKYPVVTYRQLLDKVSQGANREKLIELHFELIKDIERQEQEYKNRIMMIEQRVKETTDQLVGFLCIVRGGHRKRNMKSIISEMNLQLKAEGRKLFELKVEKRHICKSLVALY